MIRLLSKIIVNVVRRFGTETGVFYLVSHNPPSRRRIFFGTFLSIDVWDSPDHIRIGQKLFEKENTSGKAYLTRIRRVGSQNYQLHD